MRSSCAALTLAAVLAGATAPVADAAQLRAAEQVVPAPPPRPATPPHHVDLRHQPLPTAARPVERREGEDLRRAAPALPPEYRARRRPERVAVQRLDDRPSIATGRHDAAVVQNLGR